MADIQDQDNKPRQTKKGKLPYYIAAAAIVVLIAVVATYLLPPPTPEQAANQYIEDHYDAIAENIVKVAFQEHSLRTELIAEIAESIAEQVIPYSCHLPQPEDTAAEKDAVRCTLSFQMTDPIQVSLKATLNVAIEHTRDWRGRTTPLALSADLVPSELELDISSTTIPDKAIEAIEKAAEIKDQSEEALQTADEAKNSIKDLLGK